MTRRWFYALAIGLFSSFRLHAIARRVDLAYFRSRSRER